MEQDFVTMRNQPPILEKKKKYTLAHIRSLLEPLGETEERIMYVYFYLNDKLEEAEEIKVILDYEEEYIKKRFSIGNV